MRIAILADAHGNLPALEAALDEIDRRDCEAVYHLGDAIGIGPYPGECLELLLNDPRVRPVMGNHEAVFAFGVPDPPPPSTSSGASFPYLLQEKIAGLSMEFLHYALDDSGKGFAPLIPQSRSCDLDRIFAAQRGDIIFYGHAHLCSDIRGRSRYVNPGSLGCGASPVAPFVLLDAVGDKRYSLERVSVTYDDANLLQQFEEREVPDRDFILRTFFGGRGKRCSQG